MKPLRYETIRMSYKLTWESPESIWVQFSGIVTFADTMNATEELLNDPRADKVCRAFWDFSAIDGFTVSENEVEDMAAMDHVASGYTRPMMAAFVIRDAGLWMLAEKYVAILEELGSQWHNKLFDSMQDARQWAAAAG